MVVKNAVSGPSCRLLHLHFLEFTHEKESMINDELHVEHTRAGGLDVHKMQVTASVRVCNFNGGHLQCETHIFGAVPNGIEEMVQWLCREYEV